MPGLLSLANELIIRIADQLETRKNLRGTCRRVNLVISPQLLSYILIDVNKERIDLSVSQLEALASRSTSAGEHVHTVEIRRLAPHYYLDHMRSSGFPNSHRLPGPGPQDLEVDWASKKIRELLPAALSTLAGARSVIWTMPDDSSPEWMSIAVSEFLAALHSLQTLHLTMAPGAPQLHLNHNFNLTKLTVRGYPDDSVVDIVGNSPDLTDLNLEYVRSRAIDYTPTLHDLLAKVPHDHPLQIQHLRISGYCIRLNHETLPHFRQLKSLELGFVPHVQNDERTRRYGHSTRAESDNHASSFGDIWKVVRREQLSVEIVMTPLTITGAFARVDNVATLAHSGVALTEAESEMLAGKFFTQVLPHHYKTLVSLNLSVTLRGSWFIGPHSIDALLGCTQLIELSIPVDATDPTGAVKTTLDDVLGEILGVAARLPNLYQLELFSTSPEWLRRGVGNAIVIPASLDTRPRLIKFKGKRFRPCRGPGMLSDICTV
ncbi:hypothetical protein BD779DRAFT_1530954 [Infundibulicybe gibba]|nr:hypothetical protein BD779DRAFT_1530954 [Infundibulicybe gibba]